MAPGLDDAGHASDGSCGAGEGIEFGYDLVNFGLGCKSFSDHGVSDVFHRQGGDEFYLAVQAGGLGNAHLDFFEARAFEQGGQAGADVGISAAALDGLGVQRDIACERGAFRIAEITAEVYIRNDKNAAWAQGLADFSDDGAGIGQMSQKKSGVNEIEFGLRFGLAEIASAKLEIRDSESGSFLAREVNLHLIDVHSNDSSGWSDEVSEFARDIAPTATNIQAGYAGPNSGAL